MSDITGMVVAITGATSGVGAATARALAAEGARVVIGARRRERLDALVTELGEANAVAVEMDVRDPGASRRLVDAALEGFGRLDALVASAGIGAYGGIMDLTDEKLQEMMDTNIAGTVWPIRAAVPALVEAGGGDIVIVSSVAGLRGAGDEAVYAATKFAQVGLAGGLDRELRAEGIRVSTICPGGIATEFAMGAGRTPDMPGLAEMLRAEDVADAIVTVLRQPKTMRTLLWSMRSIHEDD
ncbi:putative oxidoreductase [bacterium BMS3Abin02]|nr:putative oxidoreductase [bacterium BMS3Abin02]GBE21871.1 putative oxidoreductase [bacterium BMS3Bbin01]HDH25440.1 SDR family oxidoreductase [Actinomycetota bacterium]